MAGTSFTIDRRTLALPDPELAGLLRELLRRSEPGHAGGKIAGALAAAVSGTDGVQPGTVHVHGMNRTQRLIVGQTLTDGAARAQQDGSPAAGRLAELARQWQEFAGR